MTTADSDDSVRAKIQYLARDSQHQLVKPYYLYLDYDYGLAPTNTAADDHFVQIRNARSLGIPSREMFFEWGFAQLRLDCPLTPEEYWYNKKVEEILYPKYKSIARILFPNAARVEVLEHAVRKRHPRWMSADIERHHLKTNQPSDYVHIAPGAIVPGLPISNQSQQWVHSVVQPATVPVEELRDRVKAWLAPIQRCRVFEIRVDHHHPPTPVFMSGFFAVFAVFVIVISLHVPMTVEIHAIPHIMFVSDA
ncbi:hypothetical protein BO70DRAFT_429412 [Aspergillus heteromorphus CBS 117.55]|uniref:Uncharacterized protein n=1 Tax=Aspergillus heteromorphus CBS 117.55 TaxID=1448321 RepID=A0A317W9E8_9EURO|nr:uncharacterized protein BO70DRAFT_429412 [Aspergillus heteromorphus CBS 117.55]PWY81882.1 hypothetical protein BO70DRAFT_429412 [Aspergillus heteromorphus CBS 117.55]